MAQLKVANDNEILVSAFNEQKKHSAEFGKTTAQQRIQLLKKFERAILESEHEINEALRLDYGKGTFEALMTELKPVLAEIKIINSQLKKWMKPQSVPSGPMLLGMSSKIIHQSKGTVLLIAPWNYPFALTMIPLVSALGAGNVVIVKPSEHTPHSAAMMQKLIEKVFPTNLVKVFQGGKEVSEQLLKLPFDHIFFTGSTQVGRSVALAAAANLIPVTLELGGKSPTIVDHTANIADAAEKIIWGKLLNSGQTCIAPDHVYVHESVKAEFIGACHKFLKKVSQFDQHEKVRIVSQAHFGRLQKLLTGFNDVKSVVSPLVIPTQLLEIKMEDSQNFPVMQEEIFGPLLPVMTFKNLADVLHKINSSDRPLALYLFSNDSNTIKHVLAETRSGGVCINQVMTHVTNHHLPFGGIGPSGIGAYHGHRGFVELTHQRSVLHQKFANNAFKVIFPPYKPLIEKVFRFLIRSGLG